MARQEIHFGTVFQPVRVKGSQEWVVVGIDPGNSLVTMNRYTTGDGKIALNGLSGTAFPNKEYIKSILPNTMDLSQIIEAYKAYCTDQQVRISELTIQQLIDAAGKQKNLFIDL